MLSLLEIILNLDWGPQLVASCAQVTLFRMRHWAASCGQASVCHALPVSQRSPDSQTIHSIKQTNVLQFFLLLF